VSKDGGDGAGFKQDSVPTLRIIFNRELYQCVIDGSVPNLEFARYMLQTALALTEKQITARDNPRIELAAPVPPGASLLGSHPIRMQVVP
jgi:hypothetical protein